MNKNKHYVLICQQKTNWNKISRTFAQESDAADIFLWLQWKPKNSVIHKEPQYKPLH